MSDMLSFYHCSRHGLQACEFWNRAWICCGDTKIQGMKPYFYGNSNGLSMKAGPIWKRSHLNLRSIAEKHSPKVRRMPPKWQWQPWSPVEKLILQSSVLLEMAKVVQTNYVENLRVAMQDFGKSKKCFCLQSQCHPSLRSSGGRRKFPQSFGSNAFDLSCPKICL